MTDGFETALLNRCFLHNDTYKYGGGYRNGESDE